MNLEERVLQLRTRLGEICDVSATVSMLHWDQQTYMPPKAGEGRGKQIATLSALRHRLFTSSEMTHLLESFRDDLENLPDDSRPLVEVTLYDFDRDAKLPEDFVQELAQSESNAFEAWVQAHERSEYSIFQPHLEKLVDLQKRKTDYLGFEGESYNALLEGYERGMTTERVSAVFQEIGHAQSELVQAISETEPPSYHWLAQVWKQQNQWDFGMKVLSDIGYNFSSGRQDLSAHPFTTTFGPQDVRVTTRVHEDDLFSALMSTLHEGGHALYEQGFEEADERTFLAEAASLGIHESQSRMWENMIGRSLPFWEHYLLYFRQSFPGQLDSVDAIDVYKAINRVERSLIRVEADECTYNLHVILRFELEREMLSGNLKPRDLPEAWNAKIEKYLGIPVPDDANGCLQDVHWSSASFGYFPTYALGNLYAAQLFEKILEEIPDFWSHIESGDFKPLLSWLRDRVHRHGRRLTTPEIIQQATGSELESQPYINYLKNKYEPLYGISENPSIATLSPSEGVGISTRGSN